MTTSEHRLLYVFASLFLRLDSKRLYDLTTWNEKYRSSNYSCPLAITIQGINQLLTRFICFHQQRTLILIGLAKKYLDSLFFIPFRTLMAKPGEPDDKHKNGKRRHGDGEYPPLSINLHLSIRKIENGGAQYCRNKSAREE